MGLQKAEQLDTGREILYHSIQDFNVKAGDIAEVLVFKYLSRDIKEQGFKNEAHKWYLLRDLNLKEQDEKSIYTILYAQLAEQIEEYKEATPVFEEGQTI